MTFFKKLFNSVKNEIAAYQSMGDVVRSHRRHSRSPEAKEQRDQVFQDAKKRQAAMHLHTRRVVLERFGRLPTHAEFCRTRHYMGQMFAKLRTFPRIADARVLGNEEDYRRGLFLDTDVFPNELENRSDPFFPATPLDTAAFYRRARGESDEFPGPYRDKHWYRGALIKNKYLQAAHTHLCHLQDAFVRAEASGWGKHSYGYTEDELQYSFDRHFEEFRREYHQSLDDALKMQSEVAYPPTFRDILEHIVETQSHISAGAGVALSILLLNPIPAVCGGTLLGLSIGRATLLDDRAFPGGENELHLLEKRLKRKYDPK